MSYRYALLWCLAAHKVVSTLEQRRTQRYDLQLPLQIVKMGEKRMNRVETTRDISSGGVCFMCPEQLEVGGRIEYVVTLSNNYPPIRIRCLGKILRSEKTALDSPFEVAVSMDRYQFMRGEQGAAMAATA